MSSLSSLILRQVVSAPYTTKGSTLTFTELDNNLILIADCITALNQVPPGSDLGLPAYSSDTEYSQGNFVTFDNNIWEYINATPSTGNTPAEGTFWSIRSAGVFTHQQNTDTGTNKNDFSIGDGTDSNKTISANKTGTPKPQLRWNESSSRWEFSNDGTLFTPFTPLNNYTATAPPVSSNDSGEGYSAGSAWLDVTNKILWRCVDATAAAAVWIIEIHYDVQSLTDAATVIYNTNLGPKALLDSPAANRIVNLTNLPAGVSREGYLNIKSTNGRTIQFQIAGSAANVYIVEDGKGDTAQVTSSGASDRDSFAWIWDGADLWITYLPNFTQT